MSIYDFATKNGRRNNFIHYEDTIPLIHCREPKISGSVLRVYLNGGFRRGRERRVYFSFLNYRHYKMILKKLN